MKKLLTLLAFTVSLVSAFSQSVAINSTGAAADASSALDLQSTSKGFLVPRMTLTDRNAIASPATGLLIYQTNSTPGFYYFDGSAWVQGIGVMGPAGASGPTGPAGPAGSAGAAGSTGTNGADGKTVLNGAIAPSAGIGVNGDFYINTATNTLFGPKVGGSWPAGVSMVGPTGSTGLTGATGPAPAGTGIVTVNAGVLGTPGQLSGDVTTTGAGLNSTIATGAVTSAKIADGTITGTDIANSTIDLTTKVTGLLPIANGGTGAATTSQYFVFAGPTSGAGAPSFRALTAADIPDISGTYIKNQTSQQASSNFNISGSGVIGTTLKVDNSNANTGTGSSLTFGAGAGQGIGSKKDAGGNLNGLDFYTNSTNRMSITNGGFVGIGTFPTTPLDVLASSTAPFDIIKSSGSNTIGAGLLLISTAAGGGIWNIISTANAAGEGAGKLLFKDNTSGVRMTIEGTTGNVGIANTAPSKTLDVAAKVALFSGRGADPTMRGIGTSSWTRIGGNGGGLALWGNNNVETDDVPAMFINASHNVGIGITGPSVKLDVAGDIRSTGQKYINNASPSIYLQDSDHKAGMIHMNSNLMYFLSSSGVNSTTWVSNGSVWPLTLDMNSDAATFGGPAYFMEGNVGIGTAAPAVSLAVGGTGSNVYNTSAWIENNIHVQGNETLNQGGRGRLRVGTAWGHAGLYAEPSSTAVSNDLVVGASSGLVRVGGAGTGQNLRISGLQGTGNRPVFSRC